MASEKTPGGILVRRMQFRYRDDLRAHWNRERPEWSQVVNAASLLMPYLEPYLIAAIRAALERIEDPSLRAEAVAYMGQEAHHYKQHRRFNDLLVARGYDGIRDYERTLERDYERFLAERPLEFHLAYAAGFETMALAIGHMLIRMRGWFFRGADPDVASLVLWHFVEELEHKHAAFDIYQHVVGRYGMRLYGLLFAMWHTLSRTRRAYVMLLRHDGLWGRPRTRLRMKLLMTRIFGYITPWILEACLPWHRPSRFRDPEWAREWIRLYDTGEAGLLHLDTRRIEQMPAALVGG
jgi:predicted metal-dependent hydrolase